MKQKKISQSLRRIIRRPAMALALCTLAMLAASCSDDDGENQLPDGKYPMTFSAAVDGLAVSRAAGKDMWVAKDEVAVSLNESSDSKTYQITNTSTGAMEPVNPDDMYYWKTSTEELKILAWYPATGVTNEDISNQSDGFVPFDYLKAETTATFSANGGIKLSFVHQMAKVTYSLTTDNAMTTDLSKATVSIYGCTTASFTKRTVTGSGNGWITPTTDKGALVVPQDMQSKQFIRVTISGREYFYTPGVNDANLESGKQYNYTIKVTETGLDVTVNTDLSWTDSSIAGSEGAEATTFNVYLTALSAPTNTSNYKVTDADGTILSASNGAYNVPSTGISISLSADDGYLLEEYFTKVLSGICKQRISYAADSRTYTYTFYNIRSDLKLQDLSVKVIAAASLNVPKVGDYYYSDGSWSTTKEDDKNCVGIVFKVGNNDAKDDFINYDKFLIGGDIHGYVIALQDALPTAGNWGTRDIDTPIANVDNASVTAYTGYSDTKTITNTYSGGNAWNDYQAFKAIVDYRSSVPAPDMSSNWYLPSLAQLGDVYSALGSITTPLSTAGAAFQTGSDGRYWTSTEKNGPDAWYIRMNSGNKEAYAKDGTNYSRACYARAILTF